MSFVAGLLAGLILGACIAFYAFGNVCGTVIDDTIKALRKAGRL